MSTIYPRLETLKKALEETVAPVREKTVKELDTVSIGPGEVAEFAVESAKKYSAMVVTVKATYDPSATAGIRVRWLYSADGTDYDSPEDAIDAGNYEDLTFEAGKTRQRTVLIPLLQPYVKVQIVNMDTSYSVVVTVWRTLMR
ncbi:MAG: hypothetical protein NDF55_10435 [archaeon GB-1867-005]|nr:hypothetical protein [Candidatus Culexmicrobium cathedralense]